MNNTISETASAPERGLAAVLQLVTEEVPHVRQAAIAVELVQLGWRKGPRFRLEGALEGMTRRTAHRWSRKGGTAPPSRLLRLGTLARAVALLRSGLTAQATAEQVGYPDPFTMSNQMKLMLGLRPSEVWKQSSEKIDELFRRAATTPLNRRKSRRPT